MSHRGSSSRGDAKCGKGLPPLPALLLTFLLGFALADLNPLGDHQAWAQASSGPASSGPASSEAPQSQQSQPSSPQEPSVSPAPQQQPTAVVPPWTPPIAPPPSQSHLPGIFAWPIQGTVPGALFEYHSSLTVSEQYSDNFNLNTSAQGKQSNWRTTLSPASTILINTAKTQGSISATSGFTYDSSSSTDNYNAFPSLSAAVRHAFTPRLSLTLTDSFNRSDQPTVADSSGLRQQRQAFNSNNFGASVSWLLDLVQTQYFYQNSYFSNTGTNFTNSSSQSNTTTTNQGNSASISHVLGANASTRVGVLDTVTVGYQYSISEPAQSQTSYGNLFTASLSHQLGTYASVGVQGSYSMQTVDNAKIWNGSVFGTYGLPSGFSFSGSVGYSVVNSDVASNQSGFSGNALASYAHARGTISLGIFQDYRTSYQGGQIGQIGLNGVSQGGILQSGQNFGIVQTLGITGNFSYQITPLIGSFANAAYTQNSNTGVGNNKSSPNQDSFTANAGVNWRVLRWLTASFQYSFLEFNNPTRTENTVLLSLSASF